MNGSIRVSAKTVDDAITEALIQLGVTSDRLEYEVIEKGSAGFLGIGMKQAVIEARRKPEPKEEKVEEPVVEEPVRVEPKKVEAVQPQKAAAEKKADEPQKAAFEKAVEKALRRINSRLPLLPEYLVVKQEYANVSIPLSDILYIEALGNYVKIVRISGGHVLTRSNLKAITDLLPDEAFLRIHRSYVIAVGRVEQFTKNQVKLTGKDVALPIGDCYAAQVIAVLSGSV